MREGPLKDGGITYFADYSDLVELLKQHGFKVEEQECLIKSYEKMTKFLKYSVLVMRKI